eukprot:1429130-Rhodomonas_salina.1
MGERGERREEPEHRAESGSTTRHGHSLPASQPAKQTDRDIISKHAERERERELSLARSPSRQQALSASRSPAAAHSRAAAAGSRPRTSTHAAPASAAAPPRFPPRAHADPTPSSTLRTLAAPRRPGSPPRARTRTRCGCARTWRRSMPCTARSAPTRPCPRAPPPPSERLCDLAATLRVPPLATAPHPSPDSVWPSSPVLNH